MPGELALRLSRAYPAIPRPEVRLAKRITFLRVVVTLRTHEQGHTKINADIPR